MKQVFSAASDVPQHPCPFAVEHNFSALRSYLAWPHNAYRSVLLGDEDHSFFGARAFLLSPFFNVTLLGGAGFKTVFHEFDTGLGDAFAAMKAADNSCRADTAERFLDRLDAAGYRNRDHVMQDAFQPFPITVSDGARHGVDIRPWDVRTRRVNPELVLAAEREYEKRINAVGGYLYVSENVRGLHRRVFGHDFDGGANDMYSAVIQAVLKRDIDEMLHRREEREIANHIHREGGGKRWAAIMGSAHLQGPMVEQMKQNDRYGPLTLDISLWSNRLNMLSKAYATGEASPVYVVMRDKLIMPASLGLASEKLRDFRDGLLDMAGAQPVAAPKSAATVLVP